MGLFSSLFGGGSSVTSRINLAPASELEKQAQGITGSQLTDLERLIGAGAGEQDVTDALGSQRGLATLLQQLQASGGMPSAQQLGSARQFAQDVFAPEEQAIRAGFQEQEEATSQLAARLGRQVNDPILRAKLAQEQTRQLGQVGARRTAFAAQEAQQMPLRQLGLAEQLANVRGGIASQAFANRQALFTLGQQALGAERQFRLGTASETKTASGGGGLLDVIGGISAGIGGLTNIASAGSDFLSKFKPADVGNGISGGGRGSVRPGADRLITF